MGHRDQLLVERLRIPVARIAGALKKSRQTVNRGIHRPDRDYLGPSELIKALAVWRDTDPGLYSVAKAGICEIYPEIKEAILEATASANAMMFSAEAPGEYWFVSGDFVGFKNNETACARQLELLCQNSEAQVKIFVNERDRVPAQRYASKFKRNGAEALQCTLDLRPFLNFLLHMDHDATTANLFGVTAAGFTPLSRQEATRIRSAVQDIPFKGVDAD
jgi:hypothetical protein